MQEELTETSTIDNRTPLLVSGLFLVVGLALTAFAVFRSQASIHDESGYRFSQQFDRLDASVRAQFNQPLRAMDGLGGLFAGGGRVQRAQFDAWVSSQNVAENYPGVRGFGFLERVQRTDIQRYTAQERLAQGADFAVRTSGDASDMYVVKYFAPQALNSLFRGLDAASNTAVREAIERIIRRGEPSLVRPFTPGQATPWGKEFLYLVPLYKPGSNPASAVEREAAFIGLIFAPIAIDDLLLPTLSISEGMLDFEVLDAHEEPRNALVFSSRVSVASSKDLLLPSDYSGRVFHAERTQILSGHRVTVRTGSSPALEAAMDHSTPAVIGVTGSVLSGLLAIVMLLILLGRARAQSLAMDMTKELDRLARVVQSTAHVVIVFDKQRDIVWVNEAFTRITGMALAQVKGHNFTRLFPMQDTHADTVELTRQAQDNQESLRIQVPWTSSLGAALWFDLDLQPEFDRNHELTGYVAVAADITGQRNAADQVARAMRENQALMDAIDQHSIVSITDHRGTITYANERFSEITGYTNDELVGANHRIVKSEAQTDAFWESMWKTVSSGYTWHDTVCNRAKDGSPYWVDTTIAPFFDDAGNIEKYISIRTDVSSARRAQEELAAERAHLSAIITGTNAGTWEWEVPTGKEMINERWAEMIGYTRESLGEASNGVWEQLCHPDDLKVSKDLFRRHFAGEIPHYECELRMRHRNGEWVWIQARGKVTSWLAPGQPQWVSGIHLDISRQKALQSELHQSNRVLQSILENIPVALSVFDGDLNLLARNQQFCEMLEFPDWLFAGTTTFESLIRFNAARGEYGSGDVEQAMQFLIESARHPVPHQFERVRPNGLALEVRGAPMPGGGFVTTYADISKRKASEAEMERTASLLQSVLDSASEVSVISIGTDGLITLFNKGAERMFGVTAADVVGKKSPAIFFDPDELQARASAMSAQLGREVDGFAALLDESMLGKRAEWTYIHQDGHRFAAALVVTAMTDAQGKRTGYLGVSHDISLEKDNEQALRMAVQLAEQAALSKGQFLANMSHEIRTPMNAILGMLKLLQNTELDGRQKDYAAKTESAARSLLGLLNDILDFSKVEAGKMTLDVHAFALDRVMRDLSVIMSANIGNRGIEVLFDIDPRLPPVLMGDSMRLQQVLINLGGNAIKFTEQGEVVVTVGLVGLELGQARVRFSVKDSGIGIAPENQQHIFSGFSQAEASTTRRFGGTGLGLSICRRLIDMMGGELQLHSALGQGSTFFFEVDLPVGKELLPSDGAQARPLLEPLPSVLIVDDNPTARELLRAMVASMQWPVFAVGGGAEALDCIAQRQRDGAAIFDTVLMDWQMPAMDGWDTTVALRNLPGGDKPLVVMATSAHGREVLTQRLDEQPLRLDGFLVKPVTASMLQDAVLAAREERSEGGRKRRPARTGKTRGLEGLRLLVVEDNAINQQVARELLTAEGALIDIAANGQLGVDAVAKADPQYDAVLMDLQMPVMDGYTAAVAIRHELGLYELPIIAMTANAMASDRDACLEAGMNDHIGKPFDLPELVALLCRHTGRKAVPDLSPAPAPLAPANDPPQTLDTEGALARLGDNAALYRQILDSFLKELAAVPALLDTHLAAADYVESARLMHTIKGLSLTVGAVALSGICKEAENHFKNGSAKGQRPDPDTTAGVCARLRAAVETSSEALTAVALDLGPAEPGLKPASPPSGPLDAATFVAELRNLQRLLRDSDMGALDLLATLMESYEANRPAEVNALQAAVSAFDFPKAVVQCETLINFFTPHGTQ